MAISSENWSGLGKNGASIQRVRTRYYPLQNELWRIPAGRGFRIISSLFLKKNKKHCVEAWGRPLRTDVRCRPLPVLRGLLLLDPFGGQEDGWMAGGLLAFAEVFADGVQVVVGS